MDSWIHRIKIISALLLMMYVSGCVSAVRRNPLPQDLAGSTTFWGIPEARYWGDAIPAFYSAKMSRRSDEIRKDREALFGAEHHYLAISGGGDDGAYAAGVLAGWSAVGDRPEFAIVSGVSTGAIAAPFAFLGSDYDDDLKAIYTSFSTRDLSKVRGPIKIIRGDALAQSRPLLDLMKRYINTDMLQAIAREHRRGRILVIGTTDMDAGRPVSWNIGAIAASGHPRALELVQRVILASASVPIVFPPVYFKSEIEGVVYDEMHSDGGTTNQVFLYPGQVDWKEVTRVLEVKGKPQLYVIRNSRLKPKWKETKPRIVSIARRTTGSLIRTQGIGDIYRLQWLASRDNLEFHLASIPNDFELASVGFFNPEYMRAVFQIGYDGMVNGTVWIDESEAHY